jgi:hypothetical protein
MLVRIYPILFQWTFEYFSNADVKSTLNKPTVLRPLGKRAFEQAFRHTFSTFFFTSAISACSDGIEQLGK